MSFNFLKFNSIQFNSIHNKLLVLLIVFSFLSCNSQEEVENINDKTLSLKKTQNINLSNSQIVEIGDLHNEYLDKLLQPNTRIGIQESLMANFDSILNSSIKDTKIKNNILNLVNDPSFGSISFLEKNLDEQLALDYINQIIATIELDLNYENLSLQLDVIKDVVNKDSNLINKNVVLVMIEVSKKSSYYWLPTSEGGSGKGEAILGDMNKGSRVEIKIRNVVAADGTSAAGACIGGAIAIAASGGTAGPAVLIGIGFAAGWGSATAALFS